MKLAAVLRMPVADTQAGTCYGNATGALSAPLIQLLKEFVPWPRKNQERTLRILHPKSR
jgi:hypothetical protein